MSLSTNVKRWTLVGTVTGVAAVFALASVLPATAATNHPAKQSTPTTTLVAVPTPNGFPTDVKPGTAIPIGPVDPASIPGGHNTTSAAPAN
jgi:hypothetical protein